MAHDVFISHSSKDKPIADAISANLEAAGVRCWIAPRDIAPGEDWPRAIANAISQSRIMVLIFSTNANSSDQISRELSMAADSSLVIIPFKIDNVKPEPGKQYYLARTHWLDAMNPPTQKQVNVLVERVKSIIPEAGTRNLEKTALPTPEPKDASLESEPQVRELKQHRGAVTRVAFSRRAMITVGFIALGLGLLAVFFKPLSALPAQLFATSTPTLTSTLAATSTPTESPKETITDAVRTLTGHTRSVNGVAFSPDGKLLAAGSGDNMVMLWDAASGKEVRTLAATSSVGSVAFSPDGKLLAAGSGDNTLILWDVASGQEVRTLTATSTVGSVAFSLDGKLLASGSWDKSTVTLWDVASGQEVRTLTGHTGGVDSVVAFSPDGQLLASGSWDNSTMTLREVATGQEINTFNGHNGGVYSVAFSPDGKLLASGSNDKTVKLWDVASGQEVGTLKGYTGRVSSVAFSPDGKLLAAGSGDEVTLSEVKLR